VPIPSEKSPVPTLPEPTVEEGVKVYRVPVERRSRTKVFLHTFRQSRLQQNWQNVLDVERPDLVHIEHLMGLPLGCVADLQERAIPYVVTLHDYWYVCANAQLLTNTEQKVCAGPDTKAINCAHCAFARSGLNAANSAAPLFAPIMNFRNNQTAVVLQNAGRIIAPTRFVRDIYLSLLQNELEIDVLPHGIEIPGRVVEKSQREHRNEQQGAQLHVGYIGSIARQKGVHVLISAVNALSEEDITLTIFGDLSAFPDYVSELQDLIDRPGIELLGPLDRKAIWSVIANLDLVVIPTLWYETSVLVIDEVHAMGVPVIGSDIGVLSGKIVDGENGRLYPPGDDVRLRKILSELIAVPQTLSNWRQNIEPVNSIEDHIRRLEEIYDGVINPV
jgi:glycosyltransferase involved in cell wall biosynthesis